jgi:Plasma-membrane choline transporter
VLLTSPFHYRVTVIQYFYIRQLAGYAPDECGCCASAVNSSFIRTVTTSFGSICFGSFLVALLQALRAIAQSARENGDAQIFACIAECILGCLASILEYFNKVRTCLLYHMKSSRAFLFFGYIPLRLFYIF